MATPSIPAIVPTASPLHTASAGNAGATAVQSVFRIICQDTDSSGTGFLHASGEIITAEHVIRNSQNPVAYVNNQPVSLSVTALDTVRDLALLRPANAINHTALPIKANTASLKVGSQVSTWGFPGGYPGIQAMLSVGYIAQDISFTTHRQWCVNAAFNSGNSGGPLIDIETSEVIGVVCSKLAPISPTAMSALNALQNQRSGFMYTATQPNGQTIQVSEGQIVAGILNELRQQVQLVIGMAAHLDELRAFLTRNGITP